MANALASTAVIIASVQAFISTAALSTYRNEVVLERRIESCSTYLAAASQAWTSVDKMHDQLNRASHAHLSAQSAEGRAVISGLDASMGEAERRFEALNASMLALTMVMEDETGETAARNLFAYVYGHFNEVGLRVSAWTDGGSLPPFNYRLVAAGRDELMTDVFASCQADARGRQGKAEGDQAEARDDQTDAGSRPIETQGHQP